MSWSALSEEVMREFEELSGRHNALHEALERGRHRRLWSRPAIACKTCRLWFVPLKLGRIFCSERCSRRARRKLWRRAAIRCRTCGAEFVPMHASRLYCSARCRIRHSNATAHHQAWMNALRVRRTAARACLVCGYCKKKFAGARSDQRYCSPRCGNAARAHRYVRRTFTASGARSAHPPSP